jgi:hypothetical protein
MKIYVKDTVYKISGVLLIAMGVFLSALCIIGWTSGKAEDRPYALAFSLIAAGFIIPGGILVARARQISQEESQIKSLISLIHAYRRIKLDDIALKLGQTIPETVILITKALGMNLLQGHIDRQTAEFFTEDAVQVQLQYKFCPSCGSPLDRIYLKGETVRCPACSILIS